MYGRLQEVDWRNLDIDRMNEKELIDHLKKAWKEIDYLRSELTHCKEIMTIALNRWNIVGRYDGSHGYYIPRTRVEWRAMREQ